MLDGMSDSIQGSRIENLHSREVDRQSPTGLIFITWYSCSRARVRCSSGQSDSGRVVYRSGHSAADLVPYSFSHNYFVCL